MKNVIAILVLILCVMGCAVDGAETTSDDSALLNPTPVEAPIVRPLIRSSALSPIFGVPPGSGGAFDPELCTEYPSGCDPDTGACSYFPSGCGQGGGGSGGGDGGGDGGGGGYGDCSQGLPSCGPATCEANACGGYTGYRLTTCYRTTICNSGSSWTSYDTSRSWQPSTCSPSSC